MLHFLELYPTLNILTFLVFTQQKKFYLDCILKALSVNKTVESIKFSKEKLIQLNLEDINSLRFIEKNNTIKSLDLSLITFNKSEMKIISDSLKKNHTNTEINFTSSNFEVFDFLSGCKKLKTLKFDASFCYFNPLNLIKNLELNESLTSFELDLHKLNMNATTLNVEIILNYLVKVLSNHPNLKHISLEYLNHVYGDIKLVGLLFKMQQLEELNLKHCSTINFEELFSNISESLIKLDLSNNNMENFTLNQEIKNQSIEYLNLNSNIENSFKL
jgi:hypothetical protein